MITFYVHTCAYTDPNVHARVLYLRWRGGVFAALSPPQKKEGVEPNELTFSSLIATTRDGSEQSPERGFAVRWRVGYK